MSYHSPIEVPGTPTATQYEELGAVATTKGTTGQGLKKWIYVRNTSGSAIPANSVVIRDPSVLAGDFYEVEISPVTHDEVAPLVVGITPNQIADDEYAWVQTYGPCTATAGGTNPVTADTPIVTGGLTTAGTIRDMAAGEEMSVIGHSTAQIAADGTGTVFLTLSRP